MYNKSLDYSMMGHDMQSNINDCIEHGGWFNVKRGGEYLIAGNLEYDRVELSEYCNDNGDLIDCYQFNWFTTEDEFQADYEDNCM